MALFSPNLILDDVSKINVELLRSMGVRGMVLDVDNTLSPPHQKKPTREIEAWFRMMQDAGMKMVIVSNNNGRRVGLFSENLGIEYIPFGLKPLPFAVLKAVRRMGIKRSEAVVIGDQIFTDISAANLAGIQSILVEPIDKMETFFLRVKRKLEIPVKKGYYRRLNQKK